jgi:hypothetical protein
MVPPRESIEAEVEGCERSDVSGLNEQETGNVQIRRRWRSEMGSGLQNL